jgi:hypothetical protein
MYQKVSEPATIPTPTKTIPIDDELQQDIDIVSTSHSVRTMELSPLGALGILPTELIFRILNFMHPHRYSGFPCTCKRALALVNRKLGVGE